ncbi:MAG: acetolactate decarboxylase, partial [Candidatus Sumerlaeota bacterium]|nr:acetolactate decarboxylase [Candidatus Sumerlaeota bacterium]
MKPAKPSRWILCLFLFQTLSLYAVEKLVPQQTTPFAETLTQISTINSLMAGNFDGAFTFGGLKHYGDFGIGTFNS